MLSLFSRLSDAENVHSVLHLLDADEKRELEHRLGPLVLYSPRSPDFAYECDLSLRDHYVWVQIMLNLAAVEPGENLQEVRYKRSLGDSMWIPGFEIPGFWCEEDENGDTGLPRRGLFCFRYSSSRARGCVVVKSAREEGTRRVYAGYGRPELELKL